MPVKPSANKGDMDYTDFSIQIVNFGKPRFTVRSEPEKRITWDSVSPILEQIEEMKNRVKILNWSFKRWLAFLISILWASFWTYGAFIDRENYLLHLAIGLFPPLLLILFYIEIGQNKESDMQEYIWISEYVKTKQKRKHARVVYRPSHRPFLKIGELKFEIIDISEEGIRVINNKQIELGRIENATVELLNGQSITVDGEVSRCSDKECSFHISSIPKSILLKEERIVTKSKQ